MPCPKCGWMMHDNGKNYFVCENPRCGYMKHKEIPQMPPRQRTINS